MDRNPPGGDLAGDELGDGLAFGDAPLCRMCGCCCGPYFALYAEEDDEQRWRREGRTDLLERLEYERDRVRFDDNGRPCNTETGEEFVKCVFLDTLEDGRAICGIHKTKPRICRNYPPASSELCALFKKRR